MINESRMPPSEPIACKYCHSANVRKYGLVKGIQRYFCNDCQRKFVAVDTIPKMQTSTKVIADSLNMHYEGMSLAEIRRNLIQQEGSYTDARKATAGQGCHAARAEAAQTDRTAQD